MIKKHHREILIETMLVILLILKHSSRISPDLIILSFIMSYPNVFKSISRSGPTIEFPETATFSHFPILKHYIPSEFIAFSFFMNFKFNINLIFYLSQSFEFTAKHLNWDD